VTLLERTVAAVERHDALACSIVRWLERRGLAHESACRLAAWSIGRLVRQRGSA
jgi:hypothetical protein